MTAKANSSFTLGGAARVVSAACRLRLDMTADNLSDHDASLVMAGDSRKANLALAVPPMLGRSRPENGGGAHVVRLSQANDQSHCVLPALLRAFQESPAMTSQAS